MVALVILCILFAVMFPVMVFMYIDMRTLQMEKVSIENRLVKYRTLIERCDR